MMFFTRLYFGDAEDVSKSKMFLQDGFSVSRVLVLAFFILLVILASILDLSGVVETMVKANDIPKQTEDNKFQSAKTLIDDKKVVSVTEAVNNSAEVEVVCEDEVTDCGQYLTGDVVLTVHG